MVVRSDAAGNWHELRTASDRSTSPSVSSSASSSARRDVPAPAARLFCFPHAGGSYVAFSGWQERLSSSVQVVSVCGAGRLRRLRDEPLRSLDAQIDELHGALAGLLDVPFAFFGHSLGALVAFELTRRLRRTGGPQPFVLIASGRGAPQVRPSTPDLHHLPPAELVAELHKLDGLPPGLEASVELMSLVMPALRADLEMHERYVYESEPPLSTPIVAFTGADDQQVTSDEIEAWSAQTSAAFVLETFPGGHFFTFSARDAVLATLARQMDAWHGKPRTSLNENPQWIASAS